jgi:hypothetical protein
MAYSQAIYSTINDTYQIQAKVGSKIPGDIYLGPEVKFSGNSGNSQTRLGVHLSGLNIASVNVSLSAGEIKDRQLGWGQYFSMSFYKSF